MARFFIDRPIFAWVVSLGILLAGFMALRALPIEQYPDVAPPSLAISLVYPGADAETLEQRLLLQAVLADGERPRVRSNVGVRGQPLAVTPA